MIHRRCSRQTCAFSFSHSHCSFTFLLRANRSGKAGWSAARQQPQILKSCGFFGTSVMPLKNIVVFLPSRPPAKRVSFCLWCNSWKKSRKCESVKNPKMSAAKLQNAWTGFFASILLHFFFFFLNHFDCAYSYIIWISWPCSSATIHFFEEWAFGIKKSWNNLNMYLV